MVTNEDVDEHSPALELLHSKGYILSLGVREQDVAALTRIGSQLGTREYCPGDLERRWANINMARQYMTKNGGRAVFLLRHASDYDEIIGYGWTRAITKSDKAFLPTCNYTFGLRLDEAARGQKLAAPTTESIVAASMSLFNCRGVGLQSWQSNIAAIKSYQRAGAEITTIVENQPRPTLDTLKPADENGRNITIDSRVYMYFPWSE